MSAFRKKAMDMGVEYIKATVENLDISSEVKGVEVRK